MVKQALLFFSFIFITNVISRDISSSDAHNVGLNWMRIVPDFTKTIYIPRPVIRSIKDRQNNSTLAYVLELQPTGFIIVSPDNDLHPILGFSFEAHFDTSETSENHLLQLIRLDIPQRLKALRQGQIDANYRSIANTLWQQLSTNSSQTLQKSPSQLTWITEVGPFLSSRWGQGGDAYGNYVYNYYTPNHYVCGCVATAMSQILYYYRWPVMGTDDYSYTWGTTPLAADFGATTYDWANIVDYYGSPAQPEVKRQAAGLLAYHAGISVDMDYAAGGSVAMTDMVTYSLKNYFRHYADWIPGQAPDFFDRLYQSILELRPVELSIANDTTRAGHAVVVDGVRHETTGPKYYHLNLGWWGSSDAWYDISGSFKTGGYWWNVIGGAVVNIFPLQNLDDPGTLLYSGDFTLTWDDGPNFTPEKYEVQQSILGTTLTTFTDGAESGAGNWIADGNWKQTSAQKNSGAYSFKGYIQETNSDYESGSTLELDRVVKITATTQISYYWGAYYFENTQARFEISSDDKNWVTLRSHSSNKKALPISWYSVSIAPSELASYVGQTVLFRFVVQLKGNSWWTGTGPGFYLDGINIQNINIGSWSMVDNTISATTKTITVTQSGDYAYRVRGYWSGAWRTWSDVETVSIELPATVSLQVRALLEGPYTGSGTMNTDLLNLGMIPFNSPYGEAPATANPIPAMVTDWALLQLYESDRMTVAKSLSVFIRKDGHLVDETGNSTISINGAYKSKNYYVVLKHRNHVRVMSANTINFASGSSSYDFTDNSNKYYGSNGAKSLSVGVWSLWAGDINQDGVVNINDYNLWLTGARAGECIYSADDIGLKGRVTTASYVYWYKNDRVGAQTGMPNP